VTLQRSRVNPGISREHRQVNKYYSALAVACKARSVHYEMHVASVTYCSWSLRLEACADQEYHDISLHLLTLQTDTPRYSKCWSGMPRHITSFIDLTNRHNMLFKVFHESDHLIHRNKTSKRRVCIMH